MSFLNKIVSDIEVSADTEKYRLVDADGDKTTGPTVVPAGITEQKGDATDNVDLAIVGGTKVRLTSGAGVSKHDILMPAADGEAETHDDDAASVKVGVALEDAPAGAICKCYLFDLKQA